ncbi:cation:dicarboxylase symporter family transporter [bacterium]|nr:cation:dicarboxylase symporter family transporter [bacterium]
MIAGVICGSILGPRAKELGLVGTTVIGMIKALAGPLILFAILDAFLMSPMSWKQGRRMVAIALFNATIAIAIGLFLANFLRPGEGWKSPEPVAIGKKAETGSARTIDPIRDLLHFVPQNFVQPFLENQVISIVILAVVTGAALRRVRHQQIEQGRNQFHGIENAVVSGFEVVQQIMSWIVKLVPIAVFSVVAKAVGEGGIARLAILGPYLAVIIVGLALQILIVYQSWVRFVSRYTLKRFWAAAQHPLSVALGTSSSLATMRDTLIALERKLGVSPASARLATCVGTNLNNDGILLYEAMAVLFVAQYEGITLSLGQQGIAALSCVIAGIGIGGVPDAGLISLTIVLATVGLPQEIVPLLLSVDWILSRCRAMTNVLSDMTLAVVIDAFEPEKELDSNLAGD